MSKKYGEYLTEFSKMVGGGRMAEGGEITMNVPLLLRVLELAKEDVKEDKELHFIAERLQSLSKKGTLTMEDYDYISGLESNDKIQKLIAENDSNDSDLRFEQGGGIKKKSELLAPNGKPSNLTPEQWHLVRTPEFKAWFGDWEALENAKTRDKGMDEVTLKNLALNVSKVVDENGEPKIMWHYSPNEFTIFDTKAESRWINQRKENVIWFGGSDKVISYNTGEKGFLYQCFLNVKNPIEVDAENYDKYDYYYDEKGNKNFSIQRIKGRFITQLFEIHWSGKKVNENDGVIFKNAFDNIALGLVIAVISPNQIKLADGSNTKFDSNNPDIRFEQGGMLENDVEGEYDSLYVFLSWHKEYIPIFAKKYGINESEWEDFVSGELGYDEEILQNILGDGYKLFYDEEKDIFEISEKRKRKKSGNYKIEKVSSKNEKQVLRIINEEIVTELKPRLAVFWNDMVVGGSTYEFKNGTYKFDLAILPEYQGLGISKGLIQSIIDDAKMLKAKSLEAEVVNKKLLSYLQSIGFSAYKSQGYDFVFLSLK
jgi:ribosomal protein S18 acetylase RimI-like enzyme